ncbi:hypothetical protein Cob_v012453 [Colletotrichum orbiculare MAFF 240422]|uniref:Uncharacterized protein n=1 Tax=Colletotrichum orbiculare (strain 104-T / ATCC 96160 / CBS 514.97 / LARS 414 / MAFF 240422) TaxID=1213857 RepID=A0A484F931_COLOR|nr:hypothetical protein Cob_v012453 [Colletotrichum orbiculare MAFF 240422]
MKFVSIAFLPIVLSAALRYHNSANANIERRGLGDDLSTDLILVDDDTHVKAEGKKRAIDHGEPVNIESRGLGDDLSTDLILVDDDTHVKAEGKRDVEVVA